MRLLPGIIKSRYNAARGLYDEQRWPEADRRAAGSAVAGGRSGSDRRAAQRGGGIQGARRRVPEARGSRRRAAATARAGSAARRRRRFPLRRPSTTIASSTRPMTAVTPPVTIRQEMPRWIRGAIPLPGPGTVEIIISKTGVDRARHDRPEHGDLLRSPGARCHEELAISAGAARWAAGPIQETDSHHVPVSRLDSPRAVRSPRDFAVTNVRTTVDGL